MIQGATAQAAKQGSSHAVEARELCRRFGRQHALHPLNLCVERGESFALLGANGAGKTTFLRLISGYLLPSGGSIRTLGLSPENGAVELRAKLGFVPESAQLYLDLRVLDFLRFCGGARGLRAAELRAACERALERFALGSVAKRYIGQLSKGYQQRVSLAQALLGDPELLLVDEPTAGLDPHQQQEVRALLASLRRGRTLLLCTHDLEEARALCGRAAVLRGGQLAAVGPVAELLQPQRCAEWFDPLASSAEASL